MSLVKHLAKKYNIKVMADSLDEPKDKRDLLLIKYGYIVQAVSDFDGAVHKIGFGKATKNRREYERSLKAFHNDLYEFQLKAGKLLGLG